MIAYIIVVGIVIYLIYDYNDGVKEEKATLIKKKYEDERVFPHYLSSYIEVQTIKPSNLCSKKQFETALSFNHFLDSYNHNCYISSISDDEDYGRDASEMYRSIPKRIASLKKILGVNEIPDYIYYKPDDTKYVIRLLIRNVKA